MVFRPVSGRIPEPISCLSAASISARMTPATGTYDSRGRIYSPTLERWLQSDPLGLGPDVNPYRNEGNNPASGMDPSGLVGIFFDGYKYEVRDHTIIGELYLAYKEKEGVKKFHYVPRIRRQRGASAGCVRKNQD